MNNISYNEALTMMHLSLLVYNYNTNTEFNFTEDQTIEQYVNSINKKYINGINDISLSSLEKKGILYLKQNFPDGKVILFIDNKNIQLAIIKSDILKSIVIVFRGTDSFSDILYDCYITKKYLDENIFIHTGFYNQLNSVYGKLMEIMDNYINTEYKIYISGHSAGGAHSTIFSYLLAKKTKKIIKVVTFGCPRIGNYEWKVSYESKKNIIHYRFTNNNDIITTIPCLDYYHVGTNIFLNNNDIILNYENECIRKINLFSYSICDHCLIKYYNNFITKELLYNDLIDKISQERENIIYSDSDESLNMNSPNNSVDLSNSSTEIKDCCLNT